MTTTPNDLTALAARMQEAQADEQRGKIRPCPVALEPYTISLLAEEAAEAIQMTGKWGRFGPDHPSRDGLTARRGLSLELGDVLAAIEFGVRGGVIDQSVMMEQKARKFAKLTNSASLDDEGRRLAPDLPE